MNTRLVPLLAAWVAAACTSPSSPNNPARLDVALVGSGVGFLNSVTPSGLHCELPQCTFEVSTGTEVELEAGSASHGTTFIGWAGVCSGVENCRFVAKREGQLAVAALALPRELVVANLAPQFGRVVSEPAGIDCGPDCVEQFPAGGEVTLTAEALSGGRFVGWEGACTGTEPCVVPAGQALLVAARFEPVKHRLEVLKAGAGSGTIVSDTAGAPCTAPCAIEVAEGTRVLLRPTAASGSTFSGWSGACSGLGTCVLTMDRDLTVTGTFEQFVTHTLTVSRVGTGTGFISADIGGLSCGLTCQGTYSRDTRVTLTATPNAGSRFQGWSGAGCSGSGPCSVLMTAPIELTAVFVSGVQSALAINPTTTAMLANSRVTFSASGGVPPYRFTAGAGTIDGAGSYQAPSQPVNTWVEVADALNAKARATVTVMAPPVDSLVFVSPLGRLALGEQRTLSVRGGLPPYAFSAPSNSPASVNAATGIATAGQSVGTAVFTVTDARGQTAQASYAVVNRFTAASASVPLSGGGMARAGDWNRDGRPDLVVTDGLGVSTLLQLADGGWLPTRVLSPGTDAGVVAVGDWNRDGRLDLAVSLPSRRAVATLLALEDGGVGAQADVATSDDVTDLQQADLDRDGRLDLIAARNDGVDVLLGQPDGGFGAPRPSALLGQPRELVTGDWDRDGVVDLAALSTASSVQILRGLGDGSFVDEPALSLPAPGAHLATADLNRDGRADLVITVPGDQAVHVFLGSGPSRFTFALASRSFGPEPDGLALGDWNRDGFIDVAVLDRSTGALSIARGTGAGQLSAPMTEPIAPATGTLLASDFDRDNVSDLVMVTSGAVEVRRGDWPFSPASLIAANRTAPGDFADLVSADVNRDGKDDLLGVGLAQTWWGLGDGRGEFVTTHTHTIPPSLGVIAGDWNLDGRADVARLVGATLLLDLGQSDGGFDTVSTLPALGASLSHVVSGDWNRDGRPDFAATDLMSNVKIVLAMPDGGWSVSGSVDAGINPLRVQAGDLNRDGRSDLAVLNQNGGDATILLGTGEGTFTALPVVGLGQAPIDLALLDWNRDGKLDLAVTTQSSSVVQLFLGDGSGGFPNKQVLAAGRELGRLTAGDWNDDGWADLAIASVNEASLTFLSSSATGPLPSQTLATSSVVRSLASGWWSGDGAQDLAVAHDNGVTLFLSAR